MIKKEDQQSQRQQLAFPDSPVNQTHSDDLPGPAMRREGRQGRRVLSFDDPDDVLGQGAPVSPPIRSRLFEDGLTQSGGESESFNLVDTDYSEVKRKFFDWFPPQST